MKVILKVLLIFLPWFIRRRLMIKFCGYKIHSSAKIGFAFIYPKYLEMHKGSRIDHFTVAINLDLVSMGYKSSIGRSNWITGFPTSTSSSHFEHQKNRKSQLVMGKNSAITKNHHIDCTNRVDIGNFVTIAGYNSQFLTHSINIFENRQDSKPIQIGDYSFVGTNVVVLGGSKLPNNSVLGAKSLLNSSNDQEWFLYGGVPARPIKELSKNAKYFSRKVGFVK